MQEHSANGRDTKRFAFSASTVGVGANLDSPTLDESWAPACLPIIGGHSHSVVGFTVWPSASDPVLQFDLAETSITGRQTGGVPQAEEYETVIRKTVRNLNILHRLTASIGVEIKLHYTRRPSPAAATPRQRDLIDVSVTMFDPFVISTFGVAALPPLTNLSVLNPIVLNGQSGSIYLPGIPQYAGQDFKSFRAAGLGPQSIDTLRPDPAHHKHEIGGVESPALPGGHGHGLVYTALAEPQNQFIYDEPNLDFGKFVLPGLGEVYIGEWAGSPYRQLFTFLRVEIGVKDETGVEVGVQDQFQPRTAFKGQIVIDDDGGGGGYP
ncbi:MAG TPA: hypothetical protein VEU62_10190 [Bryobacterales bacterium]|nr:hypothetical protein [Bryobacterales bacterium]